MIDLKIRYSTPARHLLDLLSVSSLYDNEERRQTIHPDDWVMIEKLARYHIVSALVYRKSHTLHILNQAPEDIAQKLREDYYAAIIQNTRLYNALGSLLYKFEKNNIPVIVLKGAYLAEKVYENIALRTMGDIDLLIPRQDLALAYQVAIDLGYQPAFKYSFDEEMSSSHSLPPLSCAGKPQVDMHWSFFSPDLPFHFDEETIWYQSRQDMLSGVKVSSLRPEHLLLHLCFHFAYMHRHGGQLFQVCDIAQVLVKFQDALDWQLILEQAQTWGTIKTTYLALATASQLLDAPVPADFLSLIQPDDHKPEYLVWLVDQVMDRQVFSINMAGLLAANSFKERFNLFLRGVFWSPRIMREKYPRLSIGLFLPLAYLIRIIDVARRQLPRAWKLVRKDLPTQEAARQLRDIEVLGRWMEEI